MRASMPILETVSTDEVNTTKQNALSDPSRGSALSQTALEKPAHIVVVLGADGACFLFLFWSVEIVKVTLALLSVLEFGDEII